MFYDPNDDSERCECKEEYGVICPLCKAEGATSPTVVYPDDLVWAAQRREEEREEREEALRIQIEDEIWDERISQAEAEEEERRAERRRFLRDD